MDSQTRRMSNGTSAVRRHDRSVAVLVRMSPEERDALHRTAESQGTTANNLALAALRPVIAGKAVGTR